MGSMAIFLLRRLPSVLAVLVATSIIAFALPRLAPGDPALAIAGADASAETLAAIRDQLGLESPLWQQYLSWIGGVLTGDLGRSYILQQPVGDLVAERMSSTLELAALAFVLDVAIGLTLGLLGGSARSRWVRSALDFLNTSFLSVPPFLIGLILILCLGIFWPILPVSGEVSIFEDFGIGIQYLILPALALALPNAVVVARQVQTSMRRVRAEEFVDLAVAKGVPAGRINRRHVMRNSLGPAVILLGIDVGTLLAGAIVVEAVFARNGLGTLAIDAVSTRDYLLLQVLILGAVFIAVIMQLLSEIALAALDPRIRLEA